MTVRRRGRPARAEKNLAPQEIVLKAQEILDSDGMAALTMRALASRLGVTPMAIYHHFGDRDGLIKAVAEKIYEPIRTESHGTARARLENLLATYYAKVWCYPELTLAIFASPAAFPDQARRITAEIENLLAGIGLNSAQLRTWLNILVDFTHGAALAAGVDWRRGSQQGAMQEDFVAAISELLRGVECAVVEARR